MNDKKARIIAFIVTIIILIFAYIEEVYIQPGYLIKCIIKVSTFGGTIALYALLSKKKLLEIINLKKPKKMWSLIGGILLFFIGIGILFFIFKNQIEWSGIRQSLVEKEGLTKQNCFIAFAYIIICNSFLEEAFFRGFVSNLFEKKKLIGYIISAFLFSAYHIGIIGGWFNIPILILCVVGLALVGLFLQWISNKYKTIIASWMVHASANIAINIIGTLLIFDILK